MLITNNKQYIWQNMKILKYHSPHAWETWTRFMKMIVCTSMMIRWYYLCVKGVNFVSFCHFGIWFWELFHRCDIFILFFITLKVNPSVPQRPCLFTYRLTSIPFMFCPFIRHMTLHHPKTILDCGFIFWYSTRYPC